MKSWVVARREISELRRAPGVWILAGLATVIGVAAVVLPAVAIDGPLPAKHAVRFLVAPLQLVVGLTGLLVGYSAIAGPRSGGQLKLVLGLPIERASLVYGAVVGRVAVVLAGVIVAGIATGIALWMVHGTLPLGTLGGFGLLLGLLAIATTSLGVGVSAASPTRWMAATAAIGLFVLFQFFWSLVPSGAHYVVEGTLPGATVPPWVVLLDRLHPFAAFRSATDVVLPEAERTIQLSGGGVDAAGRGSRRLADRVRGPVPWYLNPWAGVGTLLGWTIVPLLVGLRRFKRADL